MTPRITPRQYDLYLTGMQKFALVIPFVAFLVVSSIIFSVVPDMQGADKLVGPDPMFFRFAPILLILVFLVVFGINVGTLPYRITATLDQQLQFKSLLNLRSVRVADLTAIAPASLRVQAGMSGYLLKHRSGSIRMPGQFTGMYLLLGEIKAANPAFEIRGC